MIDLHTHSSASDGSLSPAELVFYAAEKGIRVLALTDHDTLSGVQEAQQAAQKVGIVFVPGIELNIAWPKGEFHLLGLSIDNPSPLLHSLIDFLQEERTRRNDTIIQKLEHFGIRTDRFELEAIFRTKSLGRPHIADYLILKKLVKTRQQAFDRYLAKGRPCYVDRSGADLSDAVRAIEQSGALSILAHPLSLYESWGKLPGVLEYLFDQGVAGIEAWHPGARIGECKRLEETGKKIGFFVTAGSDFHGEKIRPDRKIGKTAGLIPIDERFWTQELCCALQKRHTLTH